MKSFLRMLDMPRLKSRIISAVKNADTSIVLNEVPMLMDHASGQQAS